MDADWKTLPIRRAGKFSSSAPEKPQNYEKMVELAETLAKDIPFVRIDFYNIDGRIYVGELTFTPGLFLRFEPKGADEFLGKYLDISDIVRKVNAKKGMEKKGEAVKMKFYPGNSDLWNDTLDELWNRNGYTNSEMKTDITEVNGEYVLEVALPGVKKEDIRIELDQGYLTIAASRHHHPSTVNGHMIHQERYVGKMSRSFYVGDSLTEEYVKASYENGELTLRFPKEIKVVPEKKHISID